MSDYRQPDFYRFNQDSLDLVRFVKERVEKATSILDLGAGSGIIGLELAQHFLPKLLTLLELQSEYARFLEANLQQFLPGESAHEIVISSFSQWQPSRQYDLIVSNPPYYLPQAGLLSPNPQRARSRSFIHDDWKELLSCIERSLSGDGRAYLVVKNEFKIITSIENELLSQKLHWEFYEDHNLSFIELLKG